MFLLGEAESRDPGAAKTSLVALDGLLDGRVPGEPNGKNWKKTAGTLENL